VPAGQEALLEGLEGLSGFPEGTGVNVLKKGRKKSFVHLESVIDGKEAYLKVFRLKDIFQRLKHQVLRSKARRELEVGLAARERGVPAVLPLAAGERRHRGLLQESYLLVQRLPGAVDLLKYLSRADVTHKQKARVIEALGRLSRKTHDAGIFQEDFSLNNFLLTDSLDSHVSLIDFERTTVRKRLSAGEKEWTLAKLNRSALGGFTLADKFRFLRAYCKGREEFSDLPRWKRLERYTYQILRGDAWRISAASVRAGRGYRLYKDNRLTGYFLEGYRMEDILPIVVKGQEVKGEQRGQFVLSRRMDRIRKGGVEESVLVYELGSTQRGLALATRAWRASNGLMKGYFPVSPPVAAIEWVQEGGYRGTLLLKELEGAEDLREVLQRYSVPAGKRHSVLWHAARFLSRLHNFGTFAGNIFPGDLSWVGDQLLGDGGGKLYLTQPCNLVMKKGVDCKDRETDLQRLEDYLQGVLTEEEKDRLREQYWRYSKIIA
jgi:tRNA A-37 threonylcarbamoyl transferase component Bud32